MAADTLRVVLWSSAQGAPREPSSAQLGIPVHQLQSWASPNASFPRLDVAKGRVVKGVNFVNLRDAGDPVEVARRYDAQGADELGLSSTSRRAWNTRPLLYDMIEAVADQVFIPLTVGGGCRNLTTSARCSTPVRTRSASTPPE